MKNQIAIKAIIWDGQELDEAARTAGLTTHALRVALAKPHVIQWMMTEREVFRAFVAAKNIHRAREIRDAADNMPAMHAIKYIDGEAFDDLAKRSGDTRPGITINIIPAPPAAPPEPSRVIDVMPASAQPAELPLAIDCDPIFKQ